MMNGYIYDGYMVFRASGRGRDMMLSANLLDYLCEAKEICDMHKKRYRKTGRATVFKRTDGEKEYTWTPVYGDDAVEFCVTRPCGSRVPFNELEEWGGMKGLAVHAQSSDPFSGKTVAQSFPCSPI